MRVKLCPFKRNDFVEKALSVWKNIKDRRLYAIKWTEITISQSIVPNPISQPLTFRIVVKNLNIFLRRCHHVVLSMILRPVSHSLVLSLLVWWHCHTDQLNKVLIHEKLFLNFCWPTSPGTHWIQLGLIVIKYVSPRDSLMQISKWITALPVSDQTATATFIDFDSIFYCQSIFVSTCFYIFSRMLSQELRYIKSENESEAYERKQGGKCMKKNVTRKGCWGVLEERERMALL